MAIRRSIAELFEAIPERIEVSGQAPTWEVTGGSFESAATYAEEAFDEAVVVDRRDRSRWWPRVTLTVTNDPELAATAPPLESLVAPDLSHPNHNVQEAVMEPDPDSPGEPDEEHEDVSQDRVEDTLFDPRQVEDEEHFESFLEEIFARQERQLQERGRIPEQRRRRA
jgi:hypothetical protein